MFNEILKEVENILKYALHQMIAEISDPSFYTKKRHIKRNETFRKMFFKLYDKLKNEEMPERLILNIDDIESGIFLEVKKNNKKHYIINDNCPLKEGVRIDYDERYASESVTCHGVRFFES